MGAHAARDRVSKTRQRIELLAQRAGFHHHGVDDPVATSEVLDRLGPAWQRIDDIRWPGQSFADVDHVLVGPPGIFVIDTRPRSKAPVVAAGAKGQGDPSGTAVIEGLVAAAHAVGSLLGMTERRPVPILCFVGATEADRIVGTVLVCSTNTMLATLQSMPSTFDSPQVTGIADQVRRCLLPATGQRAALPEQRGF